MWYFQPMDRNAVLFEFGQAVDEMLNSGDIDPLTITEEEAKKIAYETYTNMPNKLYHRELMANRNNTKRKERLDSDMQHIAALVLDAKLKPIYEKIRKEDMEYINANKNLKNVFDADPLNLIDDFLHIASEYGYAKLRGDAELSKIKDTDSYKKIELALVREEAAENKQQNKMDYRGVHNQLISDVYRAVLRDAGLGPQQGGITKAEAVKHINEINGRVATIKRRVAREFDRDLTNIYRNVIAGSKLDSMPLRDGNRYMVIDHSGSKLLDKFDSANGTHAEAGLGWYFEQFVEETTENIVKQPGLGKRVWGWLWGTPATPTTKTVRKRRNSVKELTDKVVEKHKNAAYNDINVENSISINEAVMVALGLAAEKKKLSKIATKWSDVNSLTYASDIKTILNTYLDAAELGAEINSTAKMYTRLEGNEFAWLDNYFNKKAGFVYKYKDMGVDLLNKIFERAKTAESMRIPKEEETNWTKEITAIKPNKHPWETMFAVAAGLGIGGYALLHNTLAEKKITSGKDSSALNFWELLKEVLLIRLLSGRHK